jgi:hypothetical protein
VVCRSGRTVTNDGTHDTARTTGHQRVRGHPITDTVRVNNEGTPPVVVPTCRCPTGLPALDRMLGGGLAARSITVVRGGPRPGTTRLAWQFCETGAAHGERVLYVALDSSCDALVATASALGRDIARWRSSGVFLLRAMPARSILGLFRLIERVRPVRLVIDPVTPLITAPHDVTGPTLVSRLGIWAQYIGATSLWVVAPPPRTADDQGWPEEPLITAAGLGVVGPPLRRSPPGFGLPGMPVVTSPRGGIDSPKVGTPGLGVAGCTGGARDHQYGPPSPDMTPSRTRPSITRQDRPRTCAPEPVRVRAGNWKEERHGR